MSKEIYRTYVARVREITPEGDETDRVVPVYSFETMSSARVTLPGDTPRTLYFSNGYRNFGLNMMATSMICSPQARVLRWSEFDFAEKQAYGDALLRSGRSFPLYALDFPPECLDAVEMQARGMMKGDWWITPNDAGEYSLLFQKKSDGMRALLIAG